MKNTLMLLLISFAVTGCVSQSKHDSETVIYVDLKQMEKVDIQSNKSQQIYLTNGGKFTLIDDIKKILFTEYQYIIECRNCVLAFDSKTGVLETSFSGQGRARGEFTKLWDIWLEKDMLYLYDIDSKKILRYDLKGNLLDIHAVAAKAEDIPFQALAELGKNYYIGKRMYSGMEDVELNLYDRNFKFVKEVGSLKIESGIWLGYPFFVYKPDEVLYYRYLYNDIYSIDEQQNLRVKYYVDFGENNVPLNPDLKDEYDRIDFVNNSSKKYATFVSNIYESEEYFCFRFICDEGKCLGVYDKLKGNTYSFVFTSPASVVDIYTSDNKAVIVSQDMEKTYLTTIKIEDLVKK